MPEGPHRNDAVATIPEFAHNVLDVVDSIPLGKVMTYGDVAAHLGSRGARVVGQVMARYGSDVAWWRVIRADGSAPRGHEQRALTHYVSEATPLVLAGDEYRVDLNEARHRL